MGTNLDKKRGENHSRVPFMRSKIRALRRAAEALEEAIPEAPERDVVGLVLASSMNAGFALELGLKLFFMTFYKQAAHGHDLMKLFQKLPEQIRGDIVESYAASFAASGQPPVKLYGYKISKEPPKRPAGISGKDFSSAIGLLDEASDAFVVARYFFERVGAGDWAVISHPLHYMLLVSGVLDVVYDEYQKRGGWK
jgi:hypothetical protein